MAVRRKPGQLSLERDSPAPDAVESSQSPRAASAELSFEDAIEHLQHIVEQLEAEGLPLEDSLRLFEEGVRLARQSQARLESAEKRVQELLAFDETGTPIVEELDPD